MSKLEKLQIFTGLFICGGIMMELVKLSITNSEMSMESWIGLVVLWCIVDHLLRSAE